MTKQIIPVKANGGRAPAPSESSSSKENLEKSIVRKELSRFGQSRLKTICLGREGNRCVLSGTYDLTKGPTLFTLDELKDTDTGPTECAHIIPYSAAPDISREIISGRAWNTCLPSPPIVLQLTTCSWTKKPKPGLFYTGISLVLRC